MGLDERFLERVRERQDARGNVHSIWNTEINDDFREVIHVYGKTIADLATGAGIGYDIPVQRRIAQTAEHPIGQLVQVGGWSLEVDRFWKSTGLSHQGFWDKGTLLMGDGSLMNYAQYIGSAPHIFTPEDQIVQIYPVSDTSELITSLADFTARNDLLSMSGAEATPSTAE